MKDKIILNGMQFYGFHGVLPEEKRLGQNFGVDLELTVDLVKAGQTDDLTYSVNYAQVFKMVEEVVTGPSMNLLEAVAEKISGQVLHTFPLVEEVKVIIKKPGAPINGYFNFMAVEILRRRGDR